VGLELHAKLKDAKEAWAAEAAKVVAAGEANAKEAAKHAAEVGHTLRSHTILTHCARTLY
jgi:hypothetical protein